MKSFLRVLALLSLSLFAAPSQAATCSGGADCRACKSCAACRHCARSGGTCSVCRPDLYAASSGATASGAPGAASSRRAASTRAPRRNASGAVPQIIFVGKVVGIADGDTITVLHNGTPEKIRLYGIDAPEKKQAFGDAAKRYASTRAFGKVVGVRVTGMDRYKRSIGVVTLPDKTILNVEMVRVGLAWWYRQYAPREKLLTGFENVARRQRLGLWRDKSPVPPWEWRRKR